MFLDHESKIFVLLSFCLMHLWKNVQSLEAVILQMLCTFIPYDYYTISRIWYGVWCGVVQNKNYKNRCKYFVVEFY